MKFTSYSPPRYISIERALTGDEEYPWYEDLYKDHPDLLELCLTCGRRRGNHYSGRCLNHEGINPYPLDLVSINPNTTVL